MQAKKGVAMAELNGACNLFLADYITLVSQKTNP